MSKITGGVFQSLEATEFSVPPVFTARRARDNKIR